MFQAYASDPDVTRYLSWATHRTVTDTLAFIAFSEAQWAESGVGPYLICDPTTAVILGSTGLAVDAPGVAMTGYVLARSAWGRGYATEVLQAMVEVGRALGLRRVYALCHPDHRASSHVLTKGGFERDPRAGWQVPFPNLGVEGLQVADCYVLELPARA